YGKIASVFIPFCRQEPSHKTSGNAYSSQHDNHGGRVMFTVPGFSNKKEFIEGMIECGRVVFKAVTIILQEMLLNRQRLFEGGHSLLSNAMRQVCNFLRLHGNLKVVGTDLIGVGQGLRGSFVRDELRNARGRR